MSSVIVNSVASLNSALSSAQAGDTIELAPGTYSAVAIKGLNFASAVTLTSQDPTHEAVLTGLSVYGASGLAFNNLEFSFPLGNDTSVPHGIFVNWSKDVHFTSDSIHGVLDILPTNEMTGIGIANSSDISVQNSELQFLRTGLTMGSDSNVLISGNNFHDIRIDGIEGAAIQNGTVTNNDFSNFHHIGNVGQGAGDHSDAIQFWTTGQKVGSANLTVSNNVIVQGQGRDMQGIFIQDSRHHLPYTNLQVSGNLVVGGNWNGIMVDDAHGATISGNTVQGLSTQPQNPWVLLQNSNGVSVTNNSASAVNLSKNDHNVSSSGNTVNPKVTDQGLALLTDWLASHPGHLVPMGPNTAQQMVFPALTFAEIALPPPPVGTGSGPWHGAGLDAAGIQLLGLHAGDFIMPPAEL